MYHITIYILVIRISHNIYILKSTERIQDINRPGVGGIDQLENLIARQA